MKKTLFTLSLLISFTIYSQDLEFGLQASLPSYGLSLKADFTDTHSAQVIFGAFGPFSNLAGRYRYSFEETYDPVAVIPFVYAQAGSWTYNFKLLNIKESVFGYGFGAGLEFNLFDWFSDRISTTIELGYSNVDLEYYDFNATTFGFGIHYKFL